MIAVAPNQWRTVRGFVQSRKKKLPPHAVHELRDALRSVAEDIMSMMDMCEQNLGDEGMELLHLEEGDERAQHYAVGCASGAEFCIPYVRGVRLLVSMAFGASSSDLDEMIRQLESDTDPRAAEVLEALK